MLVGRSQTRRKGQGPRHNRSARVDPGDRSPADPAPARYPPLAQGQALPAHHRPGRPHRRPRGRLPPPAGAADPHRGDDQAGPHHRGEHLAAGAKSSLIANDDLTLNVLVNDAMKDPDVAYVAIADDDGTVLAHSDVAVIGKPVARPRRPRPRRRGAPDPHLHDASARGEIIDFAHAAGVQRHVRWARSTSASPSRPITDALARALNQRSDHHPGHGGRGRGGAVGLANAALAAHLPAGARDAGHRRRAISTWRCR